MKQRLLLTITATLLALASWAAGTNINGIYYVLDSSTKTASVTSTPYTSSYRDRYSGSITIPSFVTYGSSTYVVKSIGGSAFSSCTGLTRITIPNSVTSIESSAFYNCTGLTSITIPNSVTSIGNWAFRDCTGMTSIKVDAGNTVYDSRGDCNAIIETESNTLVAGCKNTTIPNSVTSIESSAFYNCTGLTSITIPNSVTSIGNWAFRDCTGMTSIKVDAGNTVYDSRGDCNAIIETESNTLVAGCKNTTIPNSVTSIESSAFYNCTGLTSITIPNSVTSIGGYAFYGTAWYNNQTDGMVYAGKVAYRYKGTMPANTNIVLKEGTTEIASSAFYECSGLTSITIPNSVTSIGGHAFYNCTGLTSITIPNSVTSIGGDAFYGTAWYNNQTDGMVYAGKVAYRYKGTMPANTNIVLKEGTTEIASSAFYECSGLTSITIPNSVTSIGSYAFRKCSGLTSITIPNSLTSIGEGVFISCTGLTSITIPNSVTSIGSSAFQGCSGLTSITIPNSVTSIGNSAFQGCSGLTSITIPNSVTSIGGDAFISCTGLTRIKVDAGNTVYDSRGDCNAIIETESNTLITGCKNTTIPNSVTSIGNWAFRNCTGMTSITIPNSVTSIGAYAFSGCSGLTSITIPNSVKRIGSDAFSGYTWSTKFYVNKGSVALLHLWSSGYSSNIYEVDTETLIVKPTLGRISATQTTVKFRINNYDDVYGYSIGCNYKTGTTTYINIFENEEEFCTLTGLRPDCTGTATLKVFIADGYSIDIATENFTTSKITPTVNIIASTGSSLTVGGSYLRGDATIAFRKLTFNGQTVNNDTIFANGLIPFTPYDVSYTIYVGESLYSSYTYTGTVMVTDFILDTQQPKVINAGNVIVSAETNIDEAETSVGFEWRRTDWPDEIASNTAQAVLYEGRIEGYVRNLYTGAFWKYRAYYESADGIRTCGEWVGIDPTNTSYFEPTVHTYDRFTVTDNTASVKGYAMRGTDAVTAQGFKYWKTSSSTRTLMDVDVPDDAMTIKASGQIMTATLTGLDFNSSYTCVAFVTTSEGETFYGEPQTFRTGEDVTGIGQIKLQGNSERLPEIVGYYNLQGQRIGKPQSGIVIVRYSDGTSRKLLVK